MPRDAIIVPKKPGTWTNKHQNVDQPIDTLYDVWNPPPPVKDMMSDLRLTVSALQSLIGHAQADGIRLRAIGAGWSLSAAGVTDGRLVNTKPLNWYFPLSARSVSTEYQGDRADLLFAQCGVSIAELNSHLAARQRSLKTSGASNGQTIAGAISTGTHGAAIDVGSMQDTVVGLHLIAGPEQSFWVERASYPVVSDDFLERLDAVPMRRDDLFNAALVSFGSFGIIHGLLFEAEPIFLLEAHRQRLPLNDPLRRAIQSLDFSGLQLPHARERPYHFEVVLNPNNIDGGAYVTSMYKRPYRNDYPHPAGPGGGLGPGDDLLSVIGTLEDVAPDLVGGLIGSFASTFYKDTLDQTGTLGETFSANYLFGKGASTEIGIPADQASKALDLILAVHNEGNPFAGFIALRFVKKSDATLAFTRFLSTCTIELPAVDSDRTRAFYKSVWNKLDQAGVPYTLHWGQENNFSADRVRAMYGNGVDQWIRSRQDLLADSMRDQFSSPFLKTCGLA